MTEPSSPAPAPENPPAPRILYVDDDAGLRRLAARALARHGYEVVPAESGAEAVDMVRAERFDLVAVDHYMPGMDGLATLRALHELPGCPPVVYVTGSEESAVAVAALKSGAEDYVVKSVGEDFFDLLAQTFAQGLERAGLRRARDAAEEQLRQTNARLEALLKEVNHRVANNLQMVMSFVGMQVYAVQDEAARDALQKTQRRIATIAQLNRLLYSGGDVENVAMDEYLVALGADISETFSSPMAARTVRVVAEAVRLPSQTAISLGMIANELVTNACKYAYAPDCSGEVRITLARDGEGRVQLEVADDGVGLPDGQPPATPKGTGLGARLIRTLARSHGADLDYTSDGNGLAVRIALPAHFVA